MRLRPSTSSDFTVSISCNVYAAPYASSAHTSISPKRCPPNCALPPSGCWVTRLYGPVERACILSSTRWCSFSICMKPTVTCLSKGSPVRPSCRVTCPPRGSPAEHGGGERHPFPQVSSHRDHVLVGESAQVLGLAAVVVDAVEELAHFHCLGP